MISISNRVLNHNYSIYESVSPVLRPFGLRFSNKMCVCKPKKINFGHQLFCILKKKPESFAGKILPEALNSRIYIYITAYSLVQYVRPYHTEQRAGHRNTFSCSGATYLFIFGPVGCKKKKKDVCTCRGFFYKGPFCLYRIRECAYLIRYGGSNHTMECALASICIHVQSMHRYHLTRYV